MELEELQRRASLLRSLGSDDTTTEAKVRGRWIAEQDPARHGLLRSCDPHRTSDEPQPGVSHGGRWNPGAAMLPLG